MTKKIFEYPLDEQPKWSENLNYFKEGESYETELEVINANGQPVWALVHGEAEHKNGRCVRIFGSLQNIDARKKVELENRKIARFNETLASLTVSDEILNGKLSQSKELITQSICQALEVNCASIKLFNQQRTQLIQFASFNRSGSENNIPWLQETIPDFFTAIERKAIFCVDDAQQHPYLAPIKESYLQPFSVKAMLCVLIPASSSSIGIVCAEQDIVRTWSHNEESFLIAVGALIGSLYSSQQRIETEAQLVKAKEAAEQAVIAKSEFLASMSHEIRTPMNGVLGMLNIVKATQLDQQQKHHIKLAQSSAESFALKAEQNNTTLILDATHITSSEFISDPNRLRQILSNLIGNAVKFTQNGEILITAKIAHTLGATVLECAIADSGIGISAEKQPHLFDSFTQADTSTTRQYGGTGLGLAIVKQLCELMGGKVSMSSTPNEGSTFSFFIKITPQLVQEHEAYQAIENKRIWVIDDCLLNTTIAKKQLTRWGAKVSTICDYLSISAYINSHEDTPPNIVLVDSALFEPLYEAQALALKQFLTKSNSHLIIMAPMSYTNKNATLPLTEETLVFKPLTPFDLQNALTAKSTIEQTHVDTQLKSLAATEVMTDTLAAHVLLVEDNKINHVVTAAFLKQLNVTFEIAENGAEAVETLNQNPANTYQLILMDCQMPTMDGYQATIAIREGKAGKVNKNITIIALTANAMQGDKDKCLATGMDDYLTKPLNATTLHSKLQQWLTSK
jgi:signal transduction histidine kinase/CheY-like chemotaxis protein